ncbi:MAG TPA: DUF2628 domain-containing protein [Burkholderiaceae bacterium]|nr:DUF2628 domain-containing protein [Burkholderiaceae bacterium]
MGRQRIYVSERGDCVVNDTGFSWFAALVSPVWALQRRLYLVALALFVMGVATSYYADTTTQLVVAVAQVALFGSLANRVHRWLLERRGWRVTAEEPVQGSGAT